MEEMKYCPTQSGVFTAYKPEFRTEEVDAWMQIPTSKHPKGVPAPKQFRGILSTIHLFGHAQASALMWWWAAVAEEAGRNIDVRIVEYEVSYDIKAKVIENTDETPVD